ncbi:enoyl-CoA hydratase-related protein [Desulfomonile tiedjei]|uniref:Enoyl-CoA hydratase/carnithine racemase n=1 Tax=Desulfomonile tiedjei (strain ATCC 49306 / DSM 6799 / DCB-1) TaxID=706587 RepID=I4C7M3_DESTA|nr:enoyl-CoA hydratase-related protein [Desulfomonile tiedjei]AFM25564.1 enoyl-CoA hydratase/carnithine racemase [Desulfomonile tiedjei DSM 6799]
MGGQDSLLRELHDGIMVLTINRPEALNCFDMSLLATFGKAVEEIAFDRDVKVVIVTGSTEGKNAFSTGADLKERAGMTPDQVMIYIRTIRNLFTAVEELPKPVIAAVNGYAFGGGLELALACDIRIAASGAIVGLTETSLAIIPGAGGTQRLPRVVGIPRAKEMIFRARRISAQEGLEIGLFLEVVEPDRLLDRSLELAREIAANGPVALAQAKYAINKGAEVSLPMGLAIESNAYAVTIPTKDRTEGLTAFREKRKPVYTGE